MVRTSATQVMVTGGVQDNTQTNFSRTLIYETTNQTWFYGPNLTFSRSLHACGSIKRNKSSSELSTIVVTGVGAASCKPNYRKFKEVIYFQSLKLVSHTKRP
jgi:hypothetical protein